MALQGVKLNCGGSCNSTYKQENMKGIQTASKHSGSHRPTGHGLTGPRVQRTTGPESTGHGPTGPQFHMPNRQNSNQGPTRRTHGNAGRIWFGKHKVWLDGASGHHIWKTPCQLLNSLGLWKKIDLQRENIAAQGPLSTVRIYFMSDPDSQGKLKKITST